MNEEEKEAVIGPKILKEIFNESLDQDAELSRNPVLKAKIRKKAEYIINLIYNHNLETGDNQVRNEIRKIIEKED